MEEFVRSLSVSIAQSGPVYSMIILLGVVFFWKVWPLIEEKSKRQDEREDRAEQRMQEESVERRRRDEEMAKLQGQWLEEKVHSTAVQEQSNEFMKSLDAKVDMLNELWKDSKEHSRGFGEDVKGMSSKIDDIHDVIVRRVETTD